MTEYDYTVYPENSPDVFRMVCRTLEVALSGIERERLLIDVEVAQYRYTMLQEKMVADSKSGFMMITMSVQYTYNLSWI